MAATIPFITSTLCTYCLLFSCLSSANDGIKALITDGQTLVSKGKRFELGFFSLNSTSRYLGIWFHGSNMSEAVWVANRDRPLQTENGIFAIAEDGILKVLESKTILWSADHYGGSPSMRSAKLMDSGNLVLREGRRVLWQSFDHPTNTFLPGMNMNRGLELTSWRTADDPSPGNFTFKKGQDLTNQYIILDRNRPYWLSTGVWQDEDAIPLLVKNLLSNYTVGDRQVDYNNTRIVMGFDGRIRFSAWNKTRGGWLQPRDRCSQFKACGSFAICSTESRQKCRCLPGFEPTSKDKWNSGDFIAGCKRKTDICSMDRVNITYLSLNVKVGKPESNSIFDVQDSLSCANDCRPSECTCQAYSIIWNNYSRRANNTCSIWSENLQNIRLNEDGVNDVLVPVALADIEYTKRDCPTCGADIIPYPLSTSPDCGDPAYRNFSCDNSTRQTSFHSAGSQYPVTSIDPEESSFTIMVNNSVCGAEDTEKVLNLQETYTVGVTRGCDSVSDSTDYIAYSSLGEPESVEIVIKWKKALEPICRSSKDCIIWPNSVCNRTLADGNKSCLCNSSFEWNGFKCVPRSESALPQETVRKRSRVLVGLVVPLVIAAIAFISCVAFYIGFKRKRENQRQGNRRSDRRDRDIQLYNSEKHVRDFIVSGGSGDDDRKAIEVPVFDIDTILGATDNFSEASKIGRGGFGTVYKGKFPGGLEIAIKRLSEGSSQGVVEFKNEVVLIAKLQHRNLVRLLGYCVAGEETMLLYEYMPNKSLDSFIFDRTQCLILNWEMRFNIIWGIVRGLVYLHEDSRLRVIHRDLKTSNVLLDAEMNPKISDFGLARIFDGKQIEATTKRVVGTYGYMSPEYALDGHFSIKSDVFSFGVVVLEIVSGKRNTGFYQSELALSLLGHAWKLWTNETPLEIADPVLRESCNPSEVIKCINVGLLCVQEDPTDRPTMSNVAFMLSSGCESVSLPNPRQPAFVARRAASLSTEAASSSSYKQDLQTDLSLLEPR